MHIDPLGLSGSLCVPDLISNLQVYLSMSPNTYFDAPWREKYDDAFSFPYLCWIRREIKKNFKAVISYLQPTRSLVTDFTSNHSTPMLELSTDFLVLFSVLL